MRRLRHRQTEFVRSRAHLLASPLPLIRRERESRMARSCYICQTERLVLCEQVPVILVGNKIDLRGGEVTNEALEAEIGPIMNEFKVRAVRHPGRHKRLTGSCKTYLGSRDLY